MYGNPYFNPQQRFQQQNMSNMQQPLMTQYVPPIPQTMPSQNGLLGKAVESVDVVKAMDIPFDGSISYFPLTDGSAIITKQLQTDGTSKTIIYKPTEENKKNEVVYATLEDIENAISELDINDISDLRNDIKEIKKQLKEFKSKKSKDDE